MNQFGKVPNNSSLEYLKLHYADNVFWNLSPAELTESTLFNQQGMLTDTGALAINTGEFTGRSPKDRFIVCDDITKDSVWWGNINMKFDAEKFDKLYDKMTAYLSNRDLYVRDAYAGADPNYQINLRVVNEYPWSNMFAYNMFLRPDDE